MSPVVQPIEPSSLALYPYATAQRMDQSQGSSATFIELLLITLAVVTSIALPLTSKLKSLNYLMWPTYTCFVITISVLFTVATFVLAVVVLALGWRRIISMDALAGAAFALSPALLSVPMDTLRYMQLLYSMRKRQSLNVRASKLRYIRGGFLCGQDENASQWGQKFSLCKGESCRVNLFLRRAPGSKRTRRGCRYRISVLAHTAYTSFKKCLNKSVKLRVKQEEDIERQVYGIRVDHTENHVVLQDEEEGLTWWWWYLLSSSMSMIYKPQTMKIVQFRDPRRMLNALELMSDIISIGDLVLMHRRSYLEWLVKNDATVQAAVGSTVEFTCNLVMKQVGLLDWWGPVGSQILKDGSRFPRRGAKKYGHLLFILTTTSQLFMTKEDRIQDDYNGWGKRGYRHRLSGQDILDDLESEAQHVGCREFERKCREAVNKWLSDWGCTRFDLHSFDSGLWS